MMKWLRERMGIGKGAGKLASAPQAEMFSLSIAIAEGMIRTLFPERTPAGDPDSILPSDPREISAVLKAVAMYVQGSQAREDGIAMGMNAALEYDSESYPSKRFLFVGENRAVIETMKKNPFIARSTMEINGQIAVDELSAPATSTEGRIFLMESNLLEKYLAEYASEKGDNTKGHAFPEKDILGTLVETVQVAVLDARLGENRSHFLELFRGSLELV